MQLQYCIILNVPSSVSNFRREVPAIAAIKTIITTETPPTTAQHASFRMFSFVEMFVEWTTERLLQADRVNRKSFYVNIEAKVRLVTYSWKGGNIKCFRYRVPKCDVIKMKFVKLWDLLSYSERTTSKTPTCQKLAIWGKLSLRY